MQRNVVSKEEIKDFSAALGVSELFAEILLARGLKTVSEAHNFLHPAPDMLSDPFALTGMEKAVGRIKEAIDNNEKVVIYGDYDCDGIMATSILYDYLLSIGVDVSYHIPNRFEDGYGLNTETLEFIAETQFPDLIITVDCGISAVEEAEYLAEVLAIDLIITDHHTLPEKLPNTIIVNPKLDEGSPCRDLCGAGVAFKLVQAIAGQEVALRYIDLAAIATIADIVPLTKENRVIAALGLRKINAHYALKKGLRMLIESCEAEKVTSSDVGFRIAPKINAVGRLGDASDIVRLFVSDEYLELEGLVDKVNNANELRKSLVAEVYNEALAMLDECDLVTHRIIYLYKETWNIGVLGLVAAKLSREFSRPALLFGGSDVLRGSARSPEGIDIYRTIQAAESLLVAFGGHKGAAGVSVKRENLIEARNLMDDYLFENYSPADFSKKEGYDAELTAKDATLAFAEELMMLEPTGEGNQRPIFKINPTDCPLTRISNTTHAKGRLNEVSEVVAFNSAYLIDGINEGVQYDLLAECGKDVYKNRERVQLKVLSAYPCGYSLPASDAISFHRYLRSNVYPEAATKFTPIKWSELKDTFYDDDFCTLFIAFSSKTAQKALSDENFSSKIKQAEYAKPFDLPHNALVLASDFSPVGYKRIVLLDTPLTKGYITYLNKHVSAEIFVVTDNYPFKDELADVEFSPAAVESSFGKIKSFVFSGNVAMSPIDLVRTLAPASPYSFLSHFYALYESGALKIGNGFAIYPQSFRDPNESTVFRRLAALKRQNESL